MAHLGTMSTSSGMRGAKVGGAPAPPVTITKHGCYRGNGSETTAQARKRKPVTPNTHERHPQSYGLHHTTSCRVGEYNTTTTNNNNNNTNNNNNNTKPDVPRRGSYQKERAARLKLPLMVMMSV